MAMKKQVKRAFRIFDFGILNFDFKPLPKPRWGAGFGSLMAGVAMFVMAAAPVRGADPTAQELLESVRLNQGAQHRVLRGELRCEGRTTPFRLVFNGNEIRYEFTGPDQTFVLKLGEKTSRLDEITKDGRERITPARFAKPVRGTDVTCEDLALRFLYWQDAKIIGEDSLGGIRYYMIELHPEPGAGSQYGKVVAWVAKKYDGVLGKAKCYAPDGKQLAAVIRVISSQTLADKSRFLKEMTIERMQGGKSGDKSPTSLEILGEEK